MELQGCGYLAAYKIKIKSRLNRQTKKLNLRNTLLLGDEKYNCSFHEVGHAIIAKSERPESRIEITIETEEEHDFWIGYIHEPNHIGQSVSPIIEGLVSIAGAVAETRHCKKSRSEKGYKLLKENSFLLDDYRKFCKSHALARDTLFLIGVNSSEIKYFEYLYNCVDHKFKLYGLNKMHSIAKDLYQNEKVVLL